MTEETFRCKKCGQTLPLTSFYRDPCARGHKTSCISCYKAQGREWEKANWEQRKAYKREHRFQNPHYLAYRAGVRRTKPEQHRQSNWHRWGILAECGTRRFDPKDYQEMLAEQNGLCSICKAEHNPSLKHGCLAVDHDHETKRVRGLLCHKCNSAIGMLGENPDTVGKALLYMTATPGMFYRPESRPERRAV